MQKLNEKELIELGDFIIETPQEKPINAAKSVLNKINEIIKKRSIIIKYLRVSDVKNHTKEQIEEINEDALKTLLIKILKIHLNKNPTQLDFEQIRFSHEINEKHKRFVYFPEGKYLGEYMNVKDKGWFCLVFRFSNS